MDTVTFGGTTTTNDALREESEKLKLKNELLASEIKSLKMENVKLTAQVLDLTKAKSKVSEAMSNLFEFVDKYKLRSPIVKKKV